MTTTDASLFPFNTDRIQDISKEDGKLFIVTDDDRRFILKLVEIGPIAEHFNAGEHQTLFYFNPSLYLGIRLHMKPRKKLFVLLWLLMCRIRLYTRDRHINVACVTSGT